jgi:hypothetical protein
MRLRITICRLFFLFIIAFCMGGCSDDLISSWDAGVIQYCFSDSVDMDVQLLVRNCMDEWEDGTVVFFEPLEECCSNCLKISVDNATKPRSTVGYSSKNIMVIESWASSRTIRHELGHVLGLLHEHQRPDRDEYVTILKENIQSAYYDNNFSIMDNPLYEEESLEYDYDSVMHYGAFAFTIESGLKTIESAFVNDWPSSQISEKDKQKVNLIYGM